MTRLISTMTTLVLLVSLTIFSSPPMAYATGTGVVDGSVSVPAGASLASVRVHLRDLSDALIGEATPDGTGAYKFAEVPEGTYIVRFMYVGQEPILSEFAGNSYRRDAAKLTIVKGGGTSHEDAALERGASLRVNLLDAFGPVGPPASLGIELVGQTPDPQTLNPVYMTLVAGVYVSSKLEPGVYRLVGSGDRWRVTYQNFVVGPGSDTPSTLFVAPGTAREIDFTLATLGIVQGSVSVSTPTGPLPFRGFAHLVPLGTASVDDIPDVGGIPVENGRFTYVAPVQGTFTLFFGSSPDFKTPRIYWPGTRDATLAATIEVVDGKVSDVGETVIEQGGLLSGTVLRKDANGTSVPSSADVELWKLDDTGHYGFYSRKHTDSSGGTGALIVETGTYAIRAKPDAASPLLGAEWHTDARYFADRIDVVVAAGESVEFQDIVLEERYFDVSRIAGANRFETAAEISKLVIPAGQRAPVVYLTNAFNFPDALSAGPAAIRAGGVILSTDPLNLPTAIGDRLSELDPSRVVILGDERSVSKAVEQAVRARVPGAQIDRLGGASRYATGELIVRDAFAGTGSPHAIIATGWNYPDALAAGPAAGLGDAPVILVDGKSGLNGASLTLLRDLGVTDVVIVGGLPSVGAQLEAGLVAELGAANVTRLAGANRYETAVLINDHFFADSDYAFLTTGQNFADALTGGPLAGSFGAPLYLSTPDCIPASAGDAMWFKNVVAIQLYGSTASLSADVEDLWTC
ncbi:cell wall-binding repeat-containing protein [Microbacterium sp. SS28]|uniref:cell wall-binding repeat-containing protein n=1 Tax=Microbacterium sp. SS28 TaxID=2919948 RepID=UPI001FAB1BAA|nr:cell wall-binding repeat-containing protein [Microbacterium sp. SS28]